MKKLTTLLLLMVASLVPSTTQASHHSPLYDTACSYRDAVVDFERHVIRARYDRHIIRLVDDLEDETSVLRSASRDPYSHRFECALNEVTALSRRVEAAIFGPSCRRPDPRIIACYEQVTCAYNELMEQVRCLSGAHDPVIAAPRVTVPRVTVPRVTVPHTTMPRVPISPLPYGVTPHHYRPNYNAPIVPGTPNFNVPVPGVRVPSIPAPNVPGNLVPPRTSVYNRHGYTRDFNRDIRATDYHRSYGRQDVGAALVGALLSRMMQ